MLPVIHHIGNGRASWVHCIMGYCIQYCMYCNAYYDKCSCSSSILYIWKTCILCAMSLQYGQYASILYLTDIRECNLFFKFRVLLSRSICHNLQLHSCNVHKLDKHLMHLLCQQTELNLNLSDWFSVAHLHFSHRHIQCSFKAPWQDFLKKTPHGF